MYIAIPFEGRVRTLIRSSFVLAKRLSETTYNLSGDAFQMTQVTAEQALVFPDEVSLEEGAELTDELLMQLCRWRALSRYRRRSASECAGPAAPDRRGGRAHLG